MSSLKKIVLVLLFCSVAFVGLRLVFGLVDMGTVQPIARNLNLPWLEHVSTFWIALFLLFTLPAKWTSIPKRLEVRGTVEIDATPEQIWETIGPFPHTPYWSAGVTHTSAVEGEENRLDFPFVQSGDNIDFEPLQAVIEAEVPEEYFAYRYLNAHVFPLMGKDLVLSEYFLEPSENGTRVTQIEHLERIRLTTVPLLLFLNPARDALQRLKAVMEGEEDTSWMGRTAQNLSQDT